MKNPLLNIEERQLIKLNCLSSDLLKLKLAVLNLRKSFQIAIEALFNKKV